MAANLADYIFKCISFELNDKLPIQISLRHVPRSLIDSNLALFQVMAWHRTGSKPLPEPAMIHFTDAFMWHSGEISYSSWVWQSPLQFHLISLWLFTCLYYNKTFCFLFQEASVFIFEKRVADKLHKPRRRETVSEILRKEVKHLSRLKHPRILKVLHPIEECQ